MKTLFLAALFLFVSCNGGGGTSNNGSSPKVTPGGQISDQQIVNNYSQTALSTVPNDLRLSDADIQSIDGEVSLTAEEKQALNNLKQ
jgi:hypothetical protein